MGEMMMQTLGIKKLLQSPTVGPKCPTAEKTHGLSIFILLLIDLNQDFMTKWQCENCVPSQF
jgi:hypothetical protein